MPRPKASTPSAAELQLHGTREWRIETVSERCWTPAAPVPAGTRSTQIPVWQKRALRGRLLLPRGAGMPSSVELRVVSPPRAEPTRVPESVIRCPVAEAGFTCDVPAVPLDLRLAAEGFAPHYWRTAKRRRTGRSISPASCRAR